MPVSAEEGLYREQHKLRLSYMPWLYFSLKDKHLAWARPWQEELQQQLETLETVRFARHCFVAPQARIFAEPGRLIEVGSGSHIAADTVLHGPITLGENVGINHHVTLEGGQKGIVIGDNTRIGSHTCIYAFNHGMSPTKLIRQQAVSSKGIHIGRDVWIGAQVSIVDGVTIGDGAVIGMGSVVTRDVAPLMKVAGNPARPLGLRS